MLEEALAMISVRTATEQDGPAIAAVYAPYVRDTAISFEEMPPTPDEMSERVRATLPTHPFLVFQEAYAVIAYAYASRHRDRAAYRWSVDVTIYVVPGVHRRGIGRTLYTRLLGILERQGFHSAYAGITLPNEKSVGLHEAMGFQHVGTYEEVGFKLGRWWNVGWWRLPLCSGSPSGEPMLYAELDEQKPGFPRN
jgi:phosphinothricin acetyltransferase